MNRVAYIAGKITGKENYKEGFAEAEKVLAAAGYIVLNPAMLPAGLTPGEYMHICMAMIDVADTIVLLPDWYESLGASLEKRYAEYTGKNVQYWGICGTCKWHDDFTGACCIGDSPHRADFTAEGESCTAWGYKNKG